MTNTDDILQLSFIVGHGRSGGERVYIEDFSVYVRDVINHVEDLKSANPGVPIFIMGHSMVWLYVIQK